MQKLSFNIYNALFRNLPGKVGPLQSLTNSEEPFPGVISSYQPLGTNRGVILIWNIYKYGKIFKFWKHLFTILNILQMSGFPSKW
jgi:hypothetical protein